MLNAGEKTCKMKSDASWQI